jgi:hypothetical protein
MASEVLPREGPSKRPEKNLQTARKEFGITPLRQVNGNESNETKIIKQ